MNVPNEIKKLADELLKSDDQGRPVLEAQDAVDVLERIVAVAKHAIEVITIVHDL